MKQVETTLSNEKSYYFKHDHKNISSRKQKEISGKNGLENEVV